MELLIFESSELYKIYMKAISTPTDNGESVTVTTRKKN